MRDREILDREAGRVEHRDLCVARASAGRAGEDGADRGHVVLARRARPRPRARARRRGSPAPSRRRTAARVRARRPATSALPGPSAPISETCWPGCSAPSSRTTSCPGVTVTSRSAASASSRDARDLAAELGRATCARASASTSHSATDRPRARNVRAAARPLTPAPIDRCRLRVGAAERLGGEDGRRACAERGHRRRVEHRLQLARRRVGDEHDARHRRQAARRVPGNDVIHLRSAWPPPSAGIARKSPAG